MKIYYFLLLTLPMISQSFPTTEDKTTTSLEEVDSEHAESGDDSQIQKRSGSFDYVTHLKSGLLSSIGHASASIASGSSGSSSGGYKSIESGHQGNSINYDPWSFKKSILNTIFQAVKAITGGVTALKGQLIKGSGYALSASGNLVAASGDKVTDVGKSIINSAQINSHIYGPTHSDGTISVHPLSKFSSLSGASSDGKHSVHSPVIHTETITSYEIPPGHSSYGPPSKPPSYSSATHQYLPPAGGSYSGGGASFSTGHAAFEAPSSNYLPSGYGHDGHDDFNIYGRHKKLTDKEARKAATELQEILNLLPNGKTEFTASKTVTLDASQAGELHPEYAELQNYGVQQELGPLESLSHTESITAGYGAQQPYRYQGGQENPADIYHQMAKKQSPEEAYIQKHPEEGYDLPQNTNQPDANIYKYNNYHSPSATNALNDLTPIIAALEVAKRKGSTGVSTQYAVQKNVHKIQAPQSGSQTQNFQPLPPLVQQSKYTYFDPAQNKVDNNYAPSIFAPPPQQRPPQPVRRQAPQLSPNLSLNKRQLSLFNAHDFGSQDTLLFNPLTTI